jgi:hypothetical protein
MCECVPVKNAGNTDVTKKCYKKEYPQARNAVHAVRTRDQLVLREGESSSKIYKSGTCIEDVVAKH